jgi:hypothetical protein
VPRLAVSCHDEFVHFACFTEPRRKGDNGNQKDYGSAKLSSKRQKMYINSNCCLLKREQKLGNRTPKWFISQNACMLLLNNREWSYRSLNGAFCYFTAVSSVLTQGKSVCVLLLVWDFVRVCLFKVGVSSWNCVYSRFVSLLINERWIGKRVEAIVAWFKLQFQHLLGGTQERDGSLSR